MTMNKTEQWRPVVGYEGIYEVSNAGRVRGTTTQGRRWKPGRIMAARPGSKGYLYVTLTNDGKPTCKHLHTIVARAFLGQRPLEKQCAHLDSNKSNCALENLEYVTPTENSKHRVSVGTYPVGEKNSRAVISECDVQDIDTLRDDFGMFFREIGEIYGISWATARAIYTRKSWSHVPKIV
jgi:hypothetical protein